MNPLVGIGLKLASTIVFTVMSAIVKVAAQSYPTGQIVFFRSFFAIAPLIVWMAWRGDLRGIARTSRPLAHLRRSVAGSAAMFCGFAALATLPLATATAIGYATPLLTTALAAFLLQEVVLPHRWGAVTAGFGGMLVMVGPALAASLTGAQGHLDPVGILFGLAGAGCAGLASIEVRRLAQQEPTGVIVFYFLMTASTLGLATAVTGWRMPSPTEFGMLVTAGILGGIGQILLTSSYRFAPASVIAPF
ncbi:DMT family transporter, partial [Nostoc sp. NIES-2111]